MRERDYHPVYGTVTRHLPETSHRESWATTASPEDWATELAELDQIQARELEHAVEEAVALKSDVHLYRKMGSRFIGIGFQPGNGPTVKIVKHPEITA